MPGYNGTTGFTCVASVVPCRRRVLVLVACAPAPGSAASYGGGVIVIAQCLDSCDSVVVNVSSATLSGNGANDGGGIHVELDSPTIVDGGFWMSNVLGVNNVAYPGTRAPIDGLRCRVDGGRCFVRALTPRHAAARCVHAHPHTPHPLSPALQTPSSACDVPSLLVCRAIIQAMEVQCICTCSARPQ